MRVLFFFFFNDTAATEIYTLSLHDALPISGRTASPRPTRAGSIPSGGSDCRSTTWSRAGRRPGPMGRRRSSGSGAAPGAGVEPMSETIDLTVHEERRAGAHGATL